MGMVSHHSPKKEVNTFVCPTTPVKREYHFGFKTHVICDVTTELPVAFSVTAANADEKKEMMGMLGGPVLSDAARRAVADCLLLDRGYDSTEMIRKVKGAVKVRDRGFRRLPDNNERDGDQQTEKWQGKNPVAKKLRMNGGGNKSMQGGCLSCPNIVVPAKPPGFLC